MDAVLHRPGSALAALLLAQVFLYWGTAILTQMNLHFDAVEMLVWGREWRLTYWKHPPLPAWVMQAMFVATGERPWAVTVTGPLFVAATFWAVWALARRILPARQAFLAVMPLVGIAYYGFTSVEFNHNVVQYPFFALVPLLLHRALRGGGAGDWALLGAVAGASIYAKYSVVPLLLAVGLFVVIDRQARASLRGLGPWLAAAVAAGVAAPHLLAVAANGFGTLHTPALNAPTARHWWQHAAFPVGWVGAQLFNCAGGILVAALLRAWPEPAGRAGGKGAVDPFDRRLVLWMLLAPAAIALVYSAVSGQMLHPMWGATFFPLLGLGGLVLMPRAPSRRAVAAATALAAVLFAANLLGYAGRNLFEPLYSGRGMRPQYPGPALAVGFERAWAEKYGDRPIPTLVGGHWAAGNIMIYGRARPPVLIDARPERSPWIDPESLTRDGAVFVWVMQAPEATRDSVDWWMQPWFDSICVQGVVEAPWQTWIDLPPVRLGWATFGPLCDKPPVFPPQ